MNDLSTQMNQQMQMLRACTDYMETISGSMDNTEASVKIVLQDMEKTHALSGSGAQNMRQTTQKMGDIFTSTQEVSALSSQLNARCGQIEGILKSIEDISMHTTILALNASVEAVRAGEHGKGFAVVASNIKQLSSATAQAVSDIDGLLRGMKTDTADMIQCSQRSLTQVEAGQQQVLDTSRLFNDIVESIQSIRTQCDIVLKHSGEVVGELQQINEQIQTTNHFFMETTAHTSDVALMVRDKSDASKQTVAKLRKLNEETNALTADVLDRLENSDQ